MQPIQWSTTLRKGRMGKRPGAAVHDDHVQRDFSAAQPNRKWGTDVTERTTIVVRAGYRCAIKGVFLNRNFG